MKTTATKTKKDALDLVYNLKSIAKKERWVPRYDVETDEFSLTIPKLSRDARIKYLSDEVAFYFSKNRIEGIFIEYFKNNFIEHHKEVKKDLKEALKEAEREASEEKTVVELSRDKINKAVSGLGEALKLSLAENMEFQPVSH